MLDYIMADITPLAFVAALGVALFAGFVKGALGFAMPMIMISGFSGIMSVEMALAGLMLPTLITNISQAFRQGVAPAVASSRLYWRMLLTMVICLLASAQFLSFLPVALLLALLGGPIVAYAVLQLMNVPLVLPVRNRARTEWAVGAVAGLYGGVSGVWGPPVMIYLLSINTAKYDMVRVLGVVFLIGAIALIGGHSVSGLMTPQRWVFSGVMVLPSVLGLWLGYKVQDRLDATRFKRWTLIMLILSGLNLLRQAALS
jgi:uncharacterized protein